MLTVGEIIQGKAVDLDYQGQGVVRYDGYVVFVKGLIDGEEAKIRIIKIHKQFGFGEIEEIIISSHDRITPISDLESCDLSHLTLEKQRAWQVKITKETLKKIANLDVEIEEILYDQNDQNYRNKTVFHVMENTFLTLGLFNKNNDKLVPVSSFDLADKPTNQMLEHLEKHKLLTDPTILKHIVFRTNPTQEMLVTLVAHAKMFVGLRELVLFFGKQSNVKGVTLNIIDNPKSILGRKSIVLYGENVLIEPLKTISVFINDRSFFQVNSPVIEKAYQVIKEEINVGDTVIDAYSGVGSIGFYLSDKAEKSTMVEINPNSIDMANKTKDRYQFSHINIIEE
ncbi:MAG: class I SAM-dependent RNA methyltransferase, partial [Acholeplasmataceae bacterium]|nr:class I SAM-dependent RNA methyltransferase [Acholeplasmataceae bacterium]